MVALPDSDPYVAEVGHAGDSNFAVLELDSSLNRVNLAVNEIGPYLGRVPINLQGEATQLEITAGGDWTITLVPLIQGARRVDSPFTGAGADVVFISESSAYAVTHAGESNFSVILYTGDDQDLVVNEIGPYDGVVPIRGPGVLVIDADGPWTFTIS